MIRKSMKSIALLLALAVSIPLTFTSCGEKKKEIVLATDVKQQVKDEEKNASKLIKVKELDLGDMGQSPICWKDDENIIVTGGSDKNKDLMDFKSVHIDDINVYNVNVKNSKITKITTIANALCGDVGKKDLYGSFIYTKDNKVCIYNALENTQKSIYDLSEIMKEQKENLKIKDEKELLKRIHCGFVLGSRKYVYVMALTSNSNCSVKVIDIENGNVIKGSFQSGYFPNIDSVRGLYSWAYNANKDRFYISSIFYNVIYECKLGEKSDIKKIKTAGGEIFDVSEDGNSLYLNGFFKNDKNSILKYDIEKDKAEELSGEITEGNGKSQQSAFEDVNVEHNNNIISYSIQGYTSEKGNKDSYKIQSTSYIGDFDGKKIKNSRMLPVEQIDNKDNGNTIMLNRKGDGFIYTVAYFDYDYKNDVTKIYKIKSYVYQIKK